jgi:hypothetical protein
MIYNYEIISFFTTTLSGWDVTGYHSRSLFIIKNRHNFGHNLRASLFVWPTGLNTMRPIFFPSDLQDDRINQIGRQKIPLEPSGWPSFPRLGHS